MCTNSPRNNKAMAQLSGSKSSNNDCSPGQGRCRVSLKHVPRTTNSGTLGGFGTPCMKVHRLWTLWAALFEQVLSHLRSYTLKILWLWGWSLPAFFNLGAKVVKDGPTVFAFPRITDYSLAVVFWRHSCTTCLISPHNFFCYWNQPVRRCILQRSKHCMFLLRAFFVTTDIKFKKIIIRWTLNLLAGADSSTDTKQNWIIGLKVTKIKVPKFSNCRFSEFPSFHVSKFPSFKVPSFQFTKLPSFQVSTFQGLNFPIVQFANFPG